MDLNIGTKNDDEHVRITTEDELQTESYIAKTVEIVSGNLTEVNLEKYQQKEVIEKEQQQPSLIDTKPVCTDQQKSTENNSNISDDINRTMETEEKSNVTEDDRDLSPKTKVLSSGDLLEVNMEEYQHKDLIEQEKQEPSTENILVSDVQQKSAGNCSKANEEINTMVPPKEMSCVAEIDSTLSANLSEDTATTSSEEIHVEHVTKLILSTNVSNNDTENQVLTVQEKKQEDKTSTLPTVALSGLNLLAQYSSEESDNDSDDNQSVIEVPAHLPDYRDSVVEIKSDSEDSDSDSSHSEPEFISEIRKAIDQEMDADEEDDDCEADGGKNDGKSKRREPPKAKGELLLDDLPPIQDLQISVPEDECIELGRIHSVVEQLVLVSALPNSVLLDLETVLFLDKGKKVLGEVFDVIGQVADPLYCIRFNSKKHIEEKNIAVGDVVYVAPKTEYTQFVILSKLTQMRGSDASWENDLEPPPRFLDYSDDEEERRARAKSSNKDRMQVKDETESNVSQAKEYTTPPAHKRHHSGQRNSQNNPRGGYRRSPYHPERAYNNQPPSGYQYENYNANSWHSNYYPAYNAAPQFNYRMPQPQMMYPPPPPPFIPPYQSYGQMPETSNSSAQPTYVLNPYAVMRSAPGMPPPNYTAAAPDSRPPNPELSQYPKPH